MPLVTPPLDAPEVQELARQINPDGKLVSVKLSSKLKPFLNCYWNVDHVVRESGGSIVLGWLFHWRPTLYVNAMHHAVWQHPGGRLIDVTHPSPNGSRSHSVFLPDKSIAFDADKPMLVRNRELTIQSHPLLEEQRKRYDALTAAQETQMLLAYKMGYRNENQKGLAAGTASRHPSLTGTDGDWASINGLINQIPILNARLAEIYSRLDSI